jgi:hypothetical protein
MYCRSKSTRRQYPKWLKQFFDHIKLEGSDLEQQGQAFLDKSRHDAGWANDVILEYVDFHRERVEQKVIAANTLRTFLRPVKTFTDAHDDVGDLIKWKRISKAMPRAKGYSNDRIPTVDELRRLVEYPDRRIKAIVYTMCSSGIRIGAWDYLKWGHVTPIHNEKTGEVIAAKLTVYAGEAEQYTSFCTPEAYHAIEDWMQYRKMYGEEITGESWVLRRIFAVADLKREKGSKVGGRLTKVSNVKRLELKAISRLLMRALYEQGLRETLDDGQRRHAFKAAHGFRKWFKSKAQQVMLGLNVEILLGHTIRGLDSNYYRVTEQELLQDYLKAVPSLTINEIQDIAILREQQENLEKKTQEKDNELEQTKRELEQLKARLEERELQKKEDIEILKKEQQKLHEEIQSALEYTMSIKKQFEYTREHELKLKAERDDLMRQFISLKNQEKEERRKKEES